MKILNPNSIKSDRLFNFYRRLATPYRAYKVAKRNGKVILPYILNIVFKRQIKHRIGECKRCGLCCVGCENLDYTTNLCKTYNRRFFCDEWFPSSPEQIDELRETHKRKLDEAISESIPCYEVQQLVRVRNMMDTWECGYKFKER
jgi:hypothetical protein